MDVVGHEHIFPIQAPHSGPFVPNLTKASCTSERARIFRRLLVHAVKKYIGESTKTVSRRQRRWGRRGSAVIDRRYSPSSFIARKIFLVGFVVTFAGSASALAEPPKNAIASEIESVLHAQQDAWNRGDIDAFMNGYWRSDETVFVSGDDVERGWQKVLERYKKRYSDRAKMGTLTFSNLEITPLSDDSAIVLGSWQLRRANDEPHGRFTLIFRRLREGWRIIHDHTSAPEPRS